MVEIDLLKYFPELNSKQLELYEEMERLYVHWNAQINVISRKDIDEFKERHLLHSLAITKLNLIKEGHKVMDLGAGGGFPGIPLAVYYPDTHFILVDSIGKKTKVMQEVCDALNLKNVEVINDRAENVHVKVEFLVNRAVAPLSKLYNWSKKNIIKNKPDNGFICLKGGDLANEISDLEELNPSLQVINTPISNYFKEPFFETKRIVRVLNF